MVRLDDLAADDAAPVLTNPGTQVNVVGDSVNLPLSATEADGDTLFYSADGLPDGLWVDPFTGVISGTVADDALQTTPYAVTVTVDDGNGGTATQTFNWSVNDSVLGIEAASTWTATEGMHTGQRHGGDVHGHRSGLGLVRVHRDDQLGRRQQQPGLCGR